MREIGNSRDSTGSVPRSPWSQAGSVAVAGLSAVAAVVVLAASCARLTPLAEAETIGRELGSFRAFLVEHKP